MTNRYIVSLAGYRIGETLLESADPPMGVVSGILIFDSIESGYDLFKTHCKSAGIAVNDDIPRDKFIDTQNIPDLKVLTNIGVEIKGQATAIAGFGEGEYEIQILGIPYPFYEEQFPEHVKKYHDSFK